MKFNIKINILSVIINIFILIVLMINIVNVTIKERCVKMSKNMKRFLTISMVIIVLVVAIIFGVNYIQNNQVRTSTNESGYSTGTDTVSGSKSITGVTAPSIGNSSQIQDNYDKQDPTKIIKKSNISMQTDNYDNSMKAINQLITTSSAMIVKMQENQGNNYYDIMKAPDSKLRSVDMTIKVYKDKFEEFNTEMKKIANVTSYYEEAQDISSSYSDIESKIASYKLQEAQLNELLKKATAAKDLLEISNQTQSVIQQREYLQRQKASYDNQIEYSTVTLRLVEVQSVEIKEKSTFSRIQDTFISSLVQMKEIFINIVMFIVYIIPYIIVLAIIILLIYIINKLKRKK
jgi:hypothetical protein